MRRLYASILLALVATSAAQAQDSRSQKISLLVGVGIPWPSNHGGFNTAYDANASGMIGIGVAVSNRVAIRSAFEYQVLNYDRRRFFDMYGFPGIDLSTQIGAVLEQFHFSVSASYTPWSVGTLEPYAFGGAGYLIRRANTSLLVYSFCRNVTTPVQVVACETASPEADINDSGPSGTAGFGIRWHIAPRWVVFTELGYLIGATTPRAELFPGRIGWEAWF